MQNSSDFRRQQITAIFQAGVTAADPYRAVKNVLHADGDSLVIDLDIRAASGQRRGTWRTIHPVAFGKAACAMAAAARDIIPPRNLAGKGIAVTTYENVMEIDNFETFGAGHPLPDAAGLRAATIITERIQAAGSGDLLLIMVSGGGSALLPSPVSAISMEEKIAVTNLLLACGANINEINCVRKHLSQLKGGAMARLAPPADLHALILSDVPGDDLGSIASGPTIADPTYFRDAAAILKAYNVWERAPASVRRYLISGIEGQQPETPKPGDAIFENCSHTLIGGNTVSIAAALKTAEQKFHAELYNGQLGGEARIAAENFAAYAKKRQTEGLGTATALIAGGETTVTLNGTGKGGRNQEMALAFALAAERLDLTGWTFLSGGTDGRDGPTDAAGGIVDTGTVARIRKSGLDPRAMLNNHDSYPALNSANGLLMTGATGTNVADLQILLLHPELEYQN